jgi:hypothetical protein
MEVTMEVRAHRSRTSKDWKELYMAALFEDDSSKIPQRIAEAERALAARAVELFGAGGDQFREQQAMENATYFLRLLRKIDGKVNDTIGEDSHRPIHPPSNQYEWA